MGFPSDSGRISGSIGLIYNDGDFLFFSYDVVLKFAAVAAVCGVYENMVLNCLLVVRTV